MSLTDQISKYQTDFYNENGKNTFYKKAQKLECAEFISSRFDINQLIQQTMFIIPNTNIVYFDYTVFKQYANPSNYEIIVNEVLALFTQCIEKYGSFEAHIQLAGFTISSTERYKTVIQSFCQKCLQSTTKYCNLLTYMYIYNTPLMIDNITTFLKPFISPVVYGKIIKYNKTESPELLKMLLTF
jgi:hypothetical protein